MKLKDTKRVQRIERKINRLLMRRENIKASVRHSKPRSNVCRLIIFRLFGWKIAIANYKNSGTLKTKLKPMPQIRSLSQSDL